MRITMSRLAVVAASAALTAAMLPAGTAAAATSASCPEAESIRLLTGTLFNLGDNKLWLYSEGTTTYVCFSFLPGLPIGGGAIVARGSISAPTVTFGSDPSVCTVNVVDLTDPVRFRIALGLTHACFTLGSSTTTVSFGTPEPAPPAIEVWRDGEISLIDLAGCAAELAAWMVSGDDTAYFACASTPARIV